MESIQQPGQNFAAELRGFGPVGIIAILAILLTGNIVLANLVVLPVGAMLVLLWKKLSRTPWGRLGYRKPVNIATTIFGGIVFGVLLKFFMKAVAMPLLGADPVNHAYHFIAGNSSILARAIWAMLVAGFAEETVFRGFMFERLQKILGERTLATVTIVIITSTLFALAHYPGQGISGVEQAAVTGLTFGTIYAIRRNIWFVMVAHAAFDLAALWMIYRDLENNIAHLIFK